MASYKPDFALDMAPAGVNLWQRNRSGDWMGLGFVARSADGFDRIIENHRAETAGDGPVPAEIRIPKSDVYFTQIKADALPDNPTDAAILDLIADRIPFRDKQAPMIVDSCPRGSGDLAVAVVPAKTLKTAAAFATDHGFDPRYFTTLYNPMKFPAEPRFHLEAPKPKATRPVRVPKTSHRKGAVLAFVAASVLCFVALALVRAVVATAPGPVAATMDQVAYVTDGRVVPASVTEPEKPLPQPRAILAGSTGPTPAFAADIAPPQALPSGLFEVALAPDIPAPKRAPAATRPAPPAPAAPALAAAEPAVAEPELRPAPASRTSLASETSEFEPSGLMTRTRRLLDNSFITIEEPKAGETGRKTIRILPAHRDEGLLRDRFDPRRFVRVAQAQTSANDAPAGLPDVDNDLLRLTESGVPVFEGKPEAVPPPRPGAGPGATRQDDGLKSFSDGVAQVLDAADGPATGVVVGSPSPGNLRPRPNPFLAAKAPTPTTPEAAPQSAYTVQPATAAKLWPRPRPDRLTRNVQNLKVEEALDQAQQEAIRENMPTANAVFVSLLPKPRPESSAKLVAATKPDLTPSQRSPTAVVRSAPQSAQKKSGTMTTSKTTESVAELATEKARLSKTSMSLIGIFGTNATRRALLRLPSGRYVKVKQGDDVGGWNVSAIGESSVRVKRGSRDEVLRMPE